jgi:hypothetical protein
MAGAVGGSMVGAYYQPEYRTGATPETEPVIVRKYLDNFHICVRQKLPGGEMYKIVADTKDKWLSQQIKKIVSANLDGEW